MMLKRVAAKIHSLILQRKWNMSPQGASLLGGGIIVRIIRNTEKSL